MMLYFLFLVLIAVARGSLKCSQYEFPCDNGECIDAGLWCDTTEDCFDESDEKYCKKSTFYNGDPNKCSDKYFKCKDGPCIPLSGRCDGFNNCGDHSDEKNCGKETSHKSDGKHPSFSSTTFPLETRTTAASTSTHAATQQTPVKMDSRATHSSKSGDSLPHSVQVVFSDLRPSDYSRQREKARNWLLSQRRHDFGWGDETPRAITALYLSDIQRLVRNESDMLMMKQLDVQLSLDMARNATKAIKLTDLALYINALLASCKDPKNFYGENLVRTLRNGVDAAQRKAEFINPSIYLTLCINNATTYEDVKKLHDLLGNRNSAFYRIDIQALAFMTVTCISQNTKLLDSPVYDGHKGQFLQRKNEKGLPGNVYEASLLAQALHNLKVTRPGLLEFLLSQQQEDGSFGGILATYLALPALAGRSFLQINDHCSQTYKTDLAPIEVLKNSKRRKMFVQYSLNYGYPLEMTQTIQMQVPEGINFLDVMRLAQEVNPKFSFMLDGHHDAPVVYSIGGIPNDAEKGNFWTLYFTSKIARGQDAGRLVLHSGNIKELIPHAGDEFIFWFRSM